VTVARGSLRLSDDRDDQPAATRRPGWLGVGLAAGLCAAAGIVILASGRGEARLPPAGAVVAAPDAALVEALLARVARLEAAMAPIGEAARHAESAAAAAERVASQAGTRAAALEQAVALRGPGGDRFLAAALLLQASIATPRPWQREYQAMMDLAPPGAVARPAAEVLVSHAARGVPTEAELRERFALLMPQLVARAPRQGDALDHAIAALRGGFAAVGLSSPPEPSDQAEAIAGIAQHLRRGNLVAAVGDTAALDASLQPLLAGWLAQARARLAVEQAVQETLLRILSPAPNPS
jgi:hypothetical protein